MLIRGFSGVVGVLLFLCGTGLKAQPGAMSVERNDDYKIGLMLFQKGQYGVAQRHFDLLARQDINTKDETRASAAYYAALCAMKLYNGDARGRVDKFAEEFQLSPLKNNLYFEYANFRFSLRQYSAAQAYYEKLDPFRLDDDRLHEYQFKYGYALMNQEKTAEALRLFFKLKDANSKYAGSARYYYAHLLYVDSNYVEALNNFLPLQDDPSFGPLVPYYLAHIYYKLGNYSELLKVGEELIEKATPGRAPEIAKLMGDASYKLEDYKTAIKYLELAKEKGAKFNQNDHYQLGFAYYQSRKYDLAIGSFNKILKGREDLRQKAYYQLGDCYIRTDRKQEAMTAFKAASDLKPSPEIREDAFFNYAKLTYELNSPYRDAISTLNDFIEEFPKSSKSTEINRYLSNLYITTKDYDRALIALQKVGLESPETKETYQKIAFYRATENFNSRKYALAITKFRESLSHPQNPTFTALSHYWIGEAQYRLGSYDDALQSFETFRKSPGAFNMDEFNRSLYQTGYAYFKKFDFQNAATNFRAFTGDASPKDPRTADSYLRLGDSYLLTGGYLVATGFYQRAVKANTPLVDYALFQEAECLGLAGKKEEKIKALRKLITQYSSSQYAEESYFEVSSTHLQLEQYEDALNGFRDFIAKYPQSALLPTAHLRIGLIYSNTDQNNKAIEVCREVVRDYAGTEASIEAVSLARLSYARENRIEDYLDWIEDLDFINFSQSTLDSTAFNAAFDTYSAGDCEKSIGPLRNYISRFPKGLFVLRANYYLAQCAMKLGDTTTAQTSYEKIIALPSNEHTQEALLRLARISFHSNDYVKARSHYNDLLKIAVESEVITRAHSGLMRCNSLLGDYPQAAIHAQTVLDREITDVSLVIEARQTLVMSLIQMERYAEAYSKITELINSSDGEVKAEALYYKAFIENHDEQYEESSNTVYRLIEDLPSYKEWKMKALLLLAKNFWKQDDLFQAEYTLDFIISSDHSEEITNEAKMLKVQIEVSEDVKEKAKEGITQPDSSSTIILDVEDGLMLIDEGEELVEPLDTIKQ